MKKKTKVLFQENTFSGWGWGIHNNKTMKKKCLLNLEKKCLKQNLSSFNAESQACIQALTHADIALENITFSIDSTAYFKKGHREVLSNIFNSKSVLCLAYILKLEVFSKWPAFNSHLF